MHLKRFSCKSIILILPKTHGSLKHVKHTETIITIIWRFHFKISLFPHLNVVCCAPWSYLGSLFYDYMKTGIRVPYAVLSVACHMQRIIRNMTKCNLIKFEGKKKTKNNNFQLNCTALRDKQQSGLCSHIK